MSYLKAIVLSAVVALAIVFMVQNIEALSHPLRIRLDLFFLKFTSTPYPTYMVILLSFFVGLLAASLLGVLERYRLRKRLRQMRKEMDKLQQELSSLRNLPLTSETITSPDSAPPGEEEQAEAS